MRIVKSLETIILRKAIREINKKDLNTNEFDINMVYDRIFCLFGPCR